VSGKSRDIKQQRFKLLRIKFIMKFFLLQILMSVAFFKAFAQAPDCAKFKNGKFKTIVNGQTSIIERLGSVQNEYLINLKDTLKITFDVKWIDDCSYTLKPVEAWLATHPRVPKSAFTTVKIIATSSNSYTQTSSSNFTSQTMTSEMFKLP
jgi:hypothetical protein